MTKRSQVSGLRSKVVVIWALAAGIAAAATTPTPTPRPKLSGGFGRPRATPAPTPEGIAATSSEPVRAAQAANGQRTEKSTLTIDNRSLVTNPDKGRVSTSRIAPASTPHPPAAASGAAPTPAAVADGSLTGGTEAEWRETARKARKRVEDGKLRVEELTAAAKKLENDFYAWDDGQYRDRVIKPSWDRTRAELDQAKIELSEAEKDLADLPERARKAGAYPGWIRE
jgi:hypothetical protein